MANDYTLPGASLHHSNSRSSRKAKKPWQSRLQPSFFSSNNGADESVERLSGEQSRASTIHQQKWWKIRLFQGMWNDVRRRAPYYWSDWRDAWDYRVVPATVYMYFAKYVEQHFYSTRFYCSFSCSSENVQYWKRAASRRTCSDFYPSSFQS